MLSNEILQKLADAYDGKAKAEEQDALAKELNALPDGQTEAAKYRQLWDGFAALRSQAFRSQLKEWEVETSEHDEEELAEWYIDNELHPAQQQKLAQQQKTDPEFEKIVNQQQDLQESFGALKTENFRQQVQYWEEEQPPDNVRQLRPWIRPLAIAASFLFILALGGNWYSQNNYSDSALAGKYYKVVPTGNTLGNDDNVRETFLEKFDEAHRELKAGTHAAAVRVFEQLATQIPPASFSDEDLKYYQDNIDWNLIIARLGAGNTTGDFELRLNRITQDKSHTYHKQAVALQEDLNSFWYW